MFSLKCYHFSKGAKSWRTEEAWRRPYCDKVKNTPVLPHIKIIIILNFSEAQLLLDDAFYVSSEIERVTEYEKGFPGVLIWFEKSVFAVKPDKNFAC